MGVQRTMGEGTKCGMVHSKLLTCSTVAGGGQDGRNKEERRQRMEERGEKPRSMLKLKVSKKKNKIAKWQASYQAVVFRHGWMILGELFNIPMPSLLQSF